LEYRRLGQTGLRVSVLGFGGIPIKDVSQREAVAVVDRALDSGVNFIHTSITYGDSAYKIGEVMTKRRDHCYLAVKIGGRERTAKEAEGRLKTTLDALRTDHVEIAELPVNAEDFPKTMEPGGAYEAFEKAKEEGVIDHIGITSHDVGFLEEAITTKRFSNLITPFNYVASSAKDILLDSASKLDMGVIAMKTLGKGGLQRPLEALWYVLAHDVDTAIVGMNKLSEVDENVHATNNLRHLSQEELEELEAIAEDIVTNDRLRSSGAVIAGKTSHRAQ
jgi:predicted aldo/keto reductase-like oxidoreductase